ncbi:unnamed protein product [Sphenostylis stenocarpa]|uniref:Secreted protein n=1 Tax=Sphenostylis stenocarpa TaxID=92480 RepID=A0AA86SJ62_9FABA|nr:unnamed protein product [Sphenostylis stenocarpa]
MQTSRVSVGPAFCLLVSSHLPCGCGCVDSWVAFDMHMSLLPLRDNHSGVCSGSHQGSNSGYGVVHLKDSMLKIFVFLGDYLVDCLLKVIVW